MLCLAHNNRQSGSPVSSQFFPQGVIAGSTPYYYVRDQLGSVTQLVTSSGGVASQFTFDPYGNRTTVSGTVVPAIGYAGYFTNAVSGLGFALYRAYDPVHARWLNRDPIGEVGGINLYAYVGANPLSSTDPYGLFNVIVGGGANAVFIGSGGEATSGGYYNVETGEGATFTSSGGGLSWASSGQSGLGAMGGSFVGFVSGPTSNVAGAFNNWNLAIPGTNISLTIYFNGDGNSVGAAVGYGPGIGFTNTNTNTTLYPGTNPFVCN